MITLGADPELFIRDESTRQLVPSCAMIGGSKGNPMPLGPRGYGIQEDNVMVEFNVPPMRTPEELGLAVIRGRNASLDLVRTRFDNQNLRWASKSEYVFHSSLLVHPLANTFGCSTDYNAYEGGAAYPVVSPDVLAHDFGQWRFAGGHVHLGYENAARVPGHVVASICDVFIGLALVGLDPQRQRRTLYGQPGRYRDTAYGIEYRTPSNVWVLDSMGGEAQTAVCEGAYYAASLIDTADDPDELKSSYSKVPWGDVRRAMTQDDRQLARTLRRFIFKETSWRTN